MSTVAAGTANAGVVDEIENPNPAAKTNNWYTEDGYGGGSFGSASYGGGSYTDCSDETPARRCSHRDYLKSLPTPIDPRCEKGHYYLLNNYNPGYFGNGNNAYTDTNANNTVFTIPPSSSRASATTCSSQQRFLEVLRRSVEQLCARSLSAQLRRDRQEDG
jgi:phospholipase C